jgi:hypothetical protein
MVELTSYKALAMKDATSLFVAIAGLVLVGSVFVVMNTKTAPSGTTATANTPASKSTDTEEKANDIDKQVAKNMATGEVILMASCLGKNGSIPRDKIGDYIAAGLEKQGISRAELSANWDRYFGYAKDAEQRNGTSCLE